MGRGLRIQSDYGSCAMQIFRTKSDKPCVALYSQCTTGATYMCAVFSDHTGTAVQENFVEF